MYRKLLQEYCTADVAVLLQIFKTAQEKGIVMQAKQKPFDKGPASCVVLRVTEQLKVFCAEDVHESQQPDVDVNVTTEELDDIFL